VTFGRVVLEICVKTETDKDKETYTPITKLCSTTKEKGEE